MNIKTGIDIMYIPRMHDLLEKEGFVKKAFHESEIKPFTGQHLAGIFAAKEALMKAIGKKIDWLLLEVKKDADGRPIMNLAQEIKEKYHIEACDISISHDYQYTVASAVIKQKE